MALLGLLVTLGLHVGGVATLVHLRQAAAAAQAPPAPVSYVVARLVRLGKKRKPKMLPQKIVPKPATKKPEAVSLGADADDVPAPKKKKQPDRRAVAADRLRHSLDRAALLDQAQREIEAEGDPSGVVGGTATEASEGDVYMTRIADLWNRTWSLPAIIPRDEARTLQVLIVLRVDREGNIQFPLTFDRLSGNEHFDGSIRSAWARIGRLPLPPPDRLASILVHGLALRLTWKGLR